MRRMILLLLTAVLLLSLAAPTAAMPTADLTVLARYFPEKTVMFASIRMDDDFFSSLDPILALLHEYVPDVPEMTTEQLFDQILAESSDIDGTFAETIRPWLGDTAAFGLPSAAGLFEEAMDNSQEPALLAVEVTDRAALLAFLRELPLNEERVRFEDAGDHTLITDGDDPSFAIYIDDTVMLMTNNPALLPEETVTTGLESSEDFQNSLGSLPETDYNAVFYMNLSELFDNLPTGSTDSPEGAMLSAVSPFENAFGGTAIGATILQNRSLTLDIAQPILDASAYAGMGIALPTDYAPVDFSFARFIPAGTPLVFQSADLQMLYEYMVDSLTAAAEMQAEIAPESEVSPVEELEQGLVQLEFVVNGLTRLDLQDDVLSWMTGDYALALNFSPVISDLSSTSDIPSEFPFDFSFLIEATDADAAQAVVDGIAQSLVAFGGDSYTVEEVTIGDTTAQSIHIPTNDELPFPIEIVLGASDEVFVVGTPRMAEAALNPGDGLAADPNYVEMQTFTLPEPRAVAYLSGEELAPFVRLLVISRSVNAQDEDAITNLFRLISGGSISSTVQEGGTTLVRMVLTLPDGVG